jgi:hypothetical protein
LPTASDWLSEEEANDLAFAACVITEEQLKVLHAKRIEEVGPGRYDQEIETLKNPCGTAYSGV